MGTLGETFRAAREGLGLSLLAVEMSTKIRCQYLVALEADRYDQLPAPVYVRAYVRTYASLLGLEANSMLAMYNQAQAKREVMGVQREARPMRAPSAITGGTLAALAVMVIIATVGYYLYQQYSSFVVGGLPSAQAVETTAPRPAASPGPDLAMRALTETLATPTSMPTAAPSPTATPIAGVHLEVLVKDRSWLRVQVDDKVTYEGIPEVGAKFKWDGRDKIVMRTGNAAGIEVIFNGKSEGAVGAQGEVKDLQWTARQ